MYTPIDPIEAPTLTNVPISCTNESFSVIPTLSFLPGLREVVTASSLVYDPANPQFSKSGKVAYSRSRTITTLSDIPLKLRHNGSTVDMELYVDQYSLTIEPVIKAFSKEAPPLKLSHEDDRYNRSSSSYVFKDIPTPNKSNKVWDGRWTKCVDSTGEEVSAVSRLEGLRSQCRSALERQNQIPYMTFGLAGIAHTKKEPARDKNKQKYDKKLARFLEDSYNASEIPPVPETFPLKTIEVLDEAETRPSAARIVKGRRNSYSKSYSQKELVAVLDGDYFVEWASLVTAYQDELEVDEE